MKKGITAYLELYNEEERLPITLGVLKDFDEVIIIDKSSTDRSVEIAKSYRATVYTLPYFETRGDANAKPVLEQIMRDFKNQWVFEVTCSDVYHPDLYKDMINMIQDDRYDAIEIPIYRYSMGFVSKYSYYGDLKYQRKLFRKDIYDWNITKLHLDPVSGAKRVGKLETSDPSIAIYHLTHENLDIVMERHLRYARVEANDDRENGSRKEYLNRSWRSILRVVRNYIRL